MRRVFLTAPLTPVVGTTSFRWLATSGLVPPLAEQGSRLIAPSVILPDQFPVQRFPTCSAAYPECWSILIELPRFDKTLSYPREVALSCGWVISKVATWREARLGPKILYKPFLAGLKSICLLRRETSSGSGINWSQSFAKKLQRFCLDVEIEFHHRHHRLLWTGKG